MTITAKIVADSISPQGIRLTTLQLRYPKFIHGEFMTHRVFSRNASSSRAIPVERLIQDVIDDPAMPVFWGKNRPGMQAGEELDNITPWRIDYGNRIVTRKARAIEMWLHARDEAIVNAKYMVALGVHKQIVNRILEPWAHINVVVTATEWANFDALRRHPDAQPEMRTLADAMWAAREASTPVPLQPGQWHLPYTSPQDDHEISNLLAGNKTDILIRCSVARCARVSYLTHEGKPPNVEDDLRLYDRLVGSVPLHASPAEHQATPDEPRWSHKEETYYWYNQNEHGNFMGWRQYRKMLPNESVRDR